MSRLKRIVALVWRFLDATGWIIAIIFVAIALHKINKDESHTRTVQVSGGPPAVCLREGIERALPELERLPGTGAPFQAYVRLQSHRYVGVKCPDGP